jgi:beta-fructofuranosidase
VIDLAGDGTLTIAPPEELEALRRGRRTSRDVALPGDETVPLRGIGGKALELAAEIDPGRAGRVVLLVRRSPDGAEETGIWYDAKEGILGLDMSRSTGREDVVYTQGPIDTGGVFRAADYPHPRATVEAPLALRAGEPLRLRVFLDGPMLEVFANGRQCLTQQVFPARADSLGVALRAEGGDAALRTLDAWEMGPAAFTNSAAK